MPLSTLLFLILFLHFPLPLHPQTLPHSSRLFQPIQLSSMLLHTASEDLPCPGSTILTTSIAKCTTSKAPLYIIPHRALSHDGLRCGTGLKTEYLLLTPGSYLSDPRTAFLNNLGSLYSLLSSNARAANAFNVLQGVDPIYVGFEFSGPRICGNVTQYPQHTIFFFIVPSPDDLDLNFGFAYLGVGELGMVSVQPDEQLCVYKNSRIPGPGIPEFSTPTPSPSMTAAVDMSDLYDLDDPEEVDSCFPTTTPEPYIPPSSRPTPSSTPSISVSPSVTASPSASVRVESSTEPAETSGPDGGDNGEERTEENEKECFPGDAQVQTRGGVRIRMRELKLGDEVLVGKDDYAEVFLWTHARNERWSLFVGVKRDSEEISWMSRGHLVETVDGIKMGQDIQIGDWVKEIDGWKQVIWVGRKWMKGLYNPQTLSGEIVVNGLVCLTYTKTIRPQMARALLVPMRAIWKAMRWWSVNLQMRRQVVSLVEMLTNS